MIDKIFSLLNSNSVLSLILIFSLLVVILIIYKDTINQYIRKKFNLYTSEDVKSFGSYISNISEIKNQSIIPPVVNKHIDLNDEFKYWNNIKKAKNG